VKCINDGIASEGELYRVFARGYLLFSSSLTCPQSEFELMKYYRQLMFKFYALKWKKATALWNGKVTFPQKRK